MNEPIDACEVRCAHEMAAKLTELGALARGITTPRRAYERA